MSTEAGFSGSRLIGLLLARLLPGIINLLTFVLLTRTISPSQYGVYALILSSAFMASGFGFHWLVQGVSRFAYRWRDERNRFVSSVGYGFLVSALFVSLVLPAVTIGFGFWDVESLPFLFFAMAIAILQGLFEVTSALAIAEMRNRIYAASVLMKAVITVILVYLLIDDNPGYSTALFAVIAGLCGAILLNFHSLMAFLRTRPDRLIAGQLFSQGAPIGVHYGLSVALVFADRSIVAATQGEKAVGFLAATSDVASQTLMMLMSVVYMSFYPALVRIWEASDQPRILKAFENGFRLLACIGLLSATFAAIFAPNLAYFMVGEQFRSEVQSLIPWVVAATLISCMKSFYTDTVFILKGKSAQLIPQTVFLLLLTIILQTVVVPEFGLSGAVLVMVLVQAVGLLISFSMARRIFPLPIDFKTMFGSAALCLAVGVFAWPFREVTGYFAALCQIAAYVAFAVVFWFKYRNSHVSDAPARSV
jgi:O-antigen/teichoic acid export membrane protein